MQIFSAIFSVCFIILGSLVWMVALATVIVGGIGLFRVALKWSLEIDIVEWYSKRKHNDS